MAEQSFLATARVLGGGHQPPTARPEHRGDRAATQGGTGYARAALEAETERVSSAANGSRNHTLNRAAFSLGQLVAGGALDRGLVVRELTAAAQLVGLSDQETVATIASGLTSGALKPRTVPEPTPGWNLGTPMTPWPALNHGRHAASDEPTVPGYDNLPEPPDDDPGEPGSATPIYDELTQWYISKERARRAANRIVDAEEAAGADPGDTWAERTQVGGSFVLDMPSTPPSVWGNGEAIGWAQGEALMICGPAGVGKTTVAVQLVAGRLGLGSGHLLDLPIQAGSGRVLYLAMDRPPQISRAMARLFSADDREILDDRLVVWKGPPPYDLARHPDTLVRMCEQAGADTVIVDSLKDGVLRLSDDESGGGYNAARQKALIAGVEVIELHHQRKAGGDNKKPSKLDDVYGSTWITAGAGSVMVLWAEPGDVIVELIHLKQPMEPVGPLRLLHDHRTGRSSIFHQTDLLAQARIQGRVGITVKVAAVCMFEVDEPNANQREKARYRLEKFVTDGYLVRQPGTGPTAEARYFLAEGIDVPR